MAQKYSTAVMAANAVCSPGWVVSIFFMALNFRVNKLQEQVPVGIAFRGDERIGRTFRWPLGLLNNRMLTTKSLYLYCPINGFICFTLSSI